MRVPLCSTSISPRASARSRRPDHQGWAHAGQSSSLRVSHFHENRDDQEKHSAPGADALDDRGRRCCGPPPARGPAAHGCGHPIVRSPLPRRCTGPEVDLAATELAADLLLNGPPGRAPARGAGRGQVSSMRTNNVGPVGAGWSMRRRVLAAGMRSPLIGVDGSRWTRHDLGNGAWRRGCSPARCCCVCRHYRSERARRTGLLQPGLGCAQASRLACRPR